MKRRANNTGTIYKMSGSRSKPWRARVCTGYNKDGKRNWLTIGYFGTKAEAERAIALHEIQPVSEKKNIKLSELYDEWSKTAYINISKSTIKSYKGAYNLLSVLHNKKFSDLRTVHFQSVINSLDLSQSSLQKIKILVNQLYDYAYAQDIVTKNYAKAIKIPNIPQAEKEVFSTNDIRLLKKNVDKIENVDTILILIYTGMRVQEMLDLNAFKIDLEKNIIKTGSKTKAGKDRIIPIHSEIKKYIEKRCMNPKGMFLNSTGQPVSQRVYREKIFRPILEQLGIKPMNPHCCRHTFATMLASAKVDILAIQQILGHTNYAFTADRYTHKDIDFLATEITKIE
ncbi:MAG: tyrosine-type recombinase/integrase [Eubacteriales bacterium]|jgi:site-specific recombinase XerD